MSVNARSRKTLATKRADALLQELERVARELGVKVSYEALTASVGLGGLCRVKGAYRVIIDKRASVDERAVTLAEALAKLDTSDLSMTPEARSMLRRDVRHGECKSLESWDGRARSGRRFSPGSAGDTKGGGSSSRTCAATEG